MSRATGCISYSTALDPLWKEVLSMVKHINIKFYTGSLNWFPFFSLYFPFSAFWLRLTIVQTNQLNEILETQDSFIQLWWYVCKFSDPGVYLEKENLARQCFPLLNLLVIKGRGLLSCHFLLKKGKVKQLDTLQKFKLCNH